MEFVARFTGDGDSTKFRFMLKLPMASALADLLPTIRT
jgi:hypothetical protein